MKKSMSVTLFFLLLSNLSVDRVLAQQQSNSGKYACQKIFTYGLWGYVTQRYDLGREGLLRDMRRSNMNLILSSGQLRGGQKDREHLQLLERYGIYIVPNAGENLAQVAKELKDESMILGWYIRDEPPPEFLGTFLEKKAILEEVAPNHPAMCLFYRPDSAAMFASHQPLMMTDCYPLVYMHNGTSLGPHFALADGKYKLEDDMGRFNMYGNRGIIEWMDLCRTFSGDTSHWITLQCFESGNSKKIRWRDPTINEIRLHVYMSIAGGAKGINFFIYNYLRDSYGNGRPTIHGEHTPLAEEIARLGAEITPMGPLFIESDVAEPFTVVASNRPTPDPGNRVDVRRLRSRDRNVDYLIAFNNDVLVGSEAQINLSKSFLKKRKLYDLHTLKPASVKEITGAVTYTFKLKPGAGRILTIASKSNFKSNTKTILKGKCMNEAGILDIDYDLAEKSNLKLTEAKTLRKQYQKQLSSEDYPEALHSIRSCAYAVKMAMQANHSFQAVQQNLDYVKKTLGGFGASIRLSNAYNGLSGLYWQGKADSIIQETALLRQLVEQSKAASKGLAKLPDSYEQNLKKVEKLSGSYKPAG